MAEYPTNSSLSLGASNKEATQLSPVKVESVIDGKSKVKTKPNKGIKSFLLAQDFKDIKEGVVNDIIRPKIKDIAYTIVQGCVNTIDSSIQMMIFGDVKRNPNARPGDRVSYTQYSTPRRMQPATPSMNSVYECDSLGYESRGDAEAVLASMVNHLMYYPFVTVAQMYEFSGLTLQNWTANNYGWSDLTGVSVKRSFDGDYVIDLPKARPIQ